MADLAVRPVSDPLLAGLLERTSDGVAVMDSSLRVLVWNRAAEEITGFGSDEVIGRRCCSRTLMHVDSGGRLLCGEDCPVEGTLDRARGLEREARLRHRRGHRIPVRIRTDLIRGYAEGPCVLEVFSAVRSDGDREAVIGRLRREALLDPLTGLPNRRALMERLETAAAETTRHGVRFGVVLMDMDGLKRINDGRGHPVGDEALRVMADTLRSTGRSTDTWGRWGGDEFMGIVRFASGEDLGVLCERMLGLVASSAVITADDEIQLSASAGATMADPGEAPMETVARADRLLYRSKDQGWGRLTLD